MFILNYVFVQLNTWEEDNEQTKEVKSIICPDVWFSKSPGPFRCQYSVIWVVIELWCPEEGWARTSRD